MREDDSIGYLKQQVRHKLNEAIEGMNMVPIKDMNITFNSNILDNDQTLRSSNIINESSL
jgi:hypothetical protein